MYRDCDVITIQESWASDLQDDCLVSLQDINIYCHDRPSNEKRCCDSAATFLNVD